ncbi:MAG: sigma-70 family RNA polymerase sigma factor [Pseudomonadota bacterium]
MSKSRDFDGLVRRVAEKQDREAFAQLFDHFAPRLKAYLMRLNAEDAQAEEIVQDVMLTLWRKANLFDPSKSSIATWLFRIARNRRIDAIRRDKSGLLDPEDPSFKPEELTPPDQVMDERSRDERVREALTQLPKEQLNLVRMAFFTGLSHSQIAEETGLPLGTVKSRIRLAFGRLRKTLEADEAVDIDL